MGKKYLMFVDERGFVSTDINNNFSMVGVVFSYDYFIESKDKQCEIITKLNLYRDEVFGNSNFNIPLDSIMLKENVYKNISEIQRKEFINNLPALMKNLKFTIIVSSIKQDINKVKDPYYIVAKNLIKNFYSFVVQNNGDNGGVVMETGKDHNSYITQQNFFDIYNDRSTNLSRLEDIQVKINTFIVSEKNNSTYGAGIEIANILNSILFRVSNGLREIDSKLISYNEYGKNNKIFNAIRHKIYKDKPMDLTNKILQRISYNGMKVFDKELKILKEQLRLKDKRINEKEKEISKLTNEIQLLNKQLESALLSRKNDNTLFQILSDIDIKMKGLEKSIRVVKS